MKKTFLLVLLFFSLSAVTYAQFTIRGRVKDSATGEPLVAVAVYISGTSTGSYTDENGYYWLKDLKPNTYELTCKYAGYNTKVKEIKLSGEPKVVEVHFEISEFEPVELYPPPIPKKAD